MERKPDFSEANRECNCDSSQRLLIIQIVQGVRLTEQELVIKLYITEILKIWFSNKERLNNTVSILSTNMLSNYSYE